MGRIEHVSPPLLHCVSTAGSKKQSLGGANKVPAQGFSSAADSGFIAVELKVCDWILFSGFVRPASFIPNCTRTVATLGSHTLQAGLPSPHLIRLDFNTLTITSTAYHLLLLNITAVITRLGMKEDVQTF